MNQTTQKIIASVMAITGVLAAYNILPAPWNLAIPALISGVAAVWESSPPVNRESPPSS